MDKKFSGQCGVLVSREPRTPRHSAPSGMIVCFLPASTTALPP